jgi:hypothetical protein
MIAQAMGTVGLYGYLFCVREVGFFIFNDGSSYRGLATRIQIQGS